MKSPSSVNCSGIAGFARRVRLFSLLVAVALLGSLTADARPVSSEEARLAARKWLDGATVVLEKKVSRPSAVETVSTGTAEDGTVLYYIVAADNGIAVATSAETGIEPVIAVFDAEYSDLDPDGPFAKILAGDMAMRQDNVRKVREKAGHDKTAGKASDGVAKAVSFAEDVWASLLAPEGDSEKYGRSSISDVRVAKLVQSQWDQGRVGSSYCYNYYTPNNYVCGCVATAAAQVMRYWQRPTTYVSQITRTCKVNGSEVSKTSRGGYFQWGSMPLVPSSSASSTQRMAIGHLCYDVGVSVGMNWTSQGSGSAGYKLPDAFKGVFGYASANCCTHEDYGNTTASFTLTQIKNGIWASLDAGCPAILGIYQHEVVADGYGFQSGTAYTHLNMGWSGSCDIWYNLPDIDASSQDYYSSALDEMVFNLNPDKSGDLLTGRVLNSSGQPVSGATVKATYGSQTYTATSGDYGVYALWVTGGRTYSVTATSGSQTGSKSVYVTQCVSESPSDPAGSGTIGNSWGNDITLSGSNPGPNSPLASAVNCTALQFATANYEWSDYYDEWVQLSGTSGNWYSQTSTSIDGCAARSGSISDDQMSLMAATGAAGEGIISFWWKVSSESGWDEALFYIDGNLKARWSGTSSTSWRQEAFRVDSNNHEFWWVYMKDGSYSRGSDCVWVDQVRWTPRTRMNPVWRFYCPGSASHFFTINEDEKNDLISNSSDIWNYEGVAYYAYARGTQPSGTLPLYRFFSYGAKSHFFTRNETERRNLIRNYSHIWRDEGIAFYIASGTSSGASGVYRFYSDRLRHHFFTINPNEANNLRTNPSARAIWNHYEGIGFYAWNVPVANQYSSMGSIQEGGEGAKFVDSPMPDAAVVLASRRQGVEGNGVEGKGGKLEASEARAGGDSAVALASFGLVALPDETRLPDEGVAKVDDVSVEIRAARPAEGTFASELDGEWDDGAVSMRLLLPDGVFSIPQLDEETGDVVDGDAEGAVDFELPTSGAWYLLNVKNDQGEEVFSRWMKAE